MVLKISIIIPAFNAEKYLARTLDSVCGQSFQDWQLVVVNDGSTDCTWDIIRVYCKRDPRIRGLNLPRKGCSGARNSGLNSCSPSPYVIFLDADDTWELHALGTLHAALESEANAVAVYGLCRYIDAKDTHIRLGELENDMRNREAYINGQILRIPEETYTSFNSFSVICCIRTPGAVLFRREVVEHISGFDTDLTQGEDWDLYIRASRAGRFRLLDRVVLNYRLHDKNASSHTISRRGGLRQVVLKTMQSPEDSLEQKEILCKCYTAAQRFFMVQKFKFAVSSISKREWFDSAVQLKYAAGHLAKMVRGQP